MAKFISTKKRVKCTAYYWDCLKRYSTLDKIIV